MATVPTEKATTENQLSSLAELPKWKKYPLYEALAVDFYNNNSDLSTYHNVSCKPITKNAEDDMELLSDVVTWGELFLLHWLPGVYNCSKCGNPLYSSEDKYKGPCVWPSFRRPVRENAISTITVHPYNSYVVEVKEVYCRGCDLFVGHQFEDAKEKGDTDPNAHWRH